MITIYINHDENNVVTALGTSPIGDNPIAVEVESFDIFDKPDGYKYIDGKLVLDGNLLFQYEKSKKIDELDNACTNCITGRFIATINGVQYQFSNSQSAQGNFDKMFRAFEKGYLTGLNWTAYDMEGNVVRVPVNAISMELLYVAHLTHIQTSIARFRDVLQPQVEQATTLDQINAIVW